MFLAAPVILTVLRMLMPSQRHLMIWTRRPVSVLFVLTIMLENVWICNKKLFDLALKLAHLRVKLAQVDAKLAPMADDTSRNDFFERALSLEAAAIDVFKPRSPITTKALFAGRWNELKDIRDAVKQEGLHVVIYGERGVGKTSLANVVRPTIWAMDDFGKEPTEVPERILLKTGANSEDTFSTIWHKLFEDIRWPKSASDTSDTYSTRENFSLSDYLKINDVRKVLERLPGAVFVIDEFDLTNRMVSKQFTELIKTLQDLALDCTIILVGVSETIDQLVEDHASIKRAITQIRLVRMNQEELGDILKNGQRTLGIEFSEDAVRLIVHISQGLPHYAHLLGLNAVRSAAKRFSLSTVEAEDVFEALKTAIKQAEQTVTEKHSTAIYSAHQNALHRKVLLACCLAAARSKDPFGYFPASAVIDPLRAMLPDTKVTNATYTRHLAEFCDDKRGSVLERDGQPWGYRYRFCDPLLVPYVFMDGLGSGLISGDGLISMISEEPSPS